MSDPHAPTAAPSAAAPPASAPPSSPTAAILIIGNEILSGRTKDANLSFLGGRLAELGIPVREARVVPDIPAAIIGAVNALRATHTYLFTTGGIGPTHDDITAACVAQAFGLPLTRHPEAVAILRRRYTDDQLNEARLKMAETPEGATLVENPVSGAPGFRIGNVFVLAGIPAIAQAQFRSAERELVGGAPVLSASVEAHLAEGTLAAGLTAVQARFPAIEIGSYPWYRDGRFGVSLVARGTEAALLAACRAEIEALVRSLGAEPLLSA